MINKSNIQTTDCANELLYHTIGIRNTNHSRCCNWCNKPLKYATQHLCSSCVCRNRLGVIYKPYRSIRKLSHLTKQTRKLNTPELQFKINQLLLRTCTKSNFFKTNYYNHHKSKTENKGNFTRLQAITRICLYYTMDYIAEPHHYNNQPEIYYRWVLRAVTQYMNGNRRYYSALPTTVSSYFGSEVLEICYPKIIN